MACLSAWAPLGRGPAVANPNKAKGDRAERAVLGYVSDRFPGSFKTRAGFNDDLGDVIVDTSPGRVVLQVKDVASPNWSKWFSQLADQVKTCRRESTSHNVVGGAIVHKLRGEGDPGKWRAVLPLSTYMDLVEAAYFKGVDDGARGVD